MAYSEVLLVKPVDGLGGEGDQVKVRAGYARNYLLPQNIAVPVNAANRKQVEALKKRRAVRETQELSGAQDIAAKLEKTGLLDDTLVISKFTQQASAIGRTPEEQLRALHRLRTLPLFTQAIAEALAIDLA